MNKTIKYLGFAFLGSLLFFTLGALRPFIASLNGLGVSTTMSNSVMVGTFRSMLGTVTNMDMPNTAPQHVIFLPQTANTGEFDIGDPSQTTGRYLMFSKSAGAFVIGHDGTDALRLNVANGFITLPGGGLLGDIAGETFTLNTNAIFQVSGLAQLLIAGDDIGTHRAEIFLHGTNAFIRLDNGAAIQDATATSSLLFSNGFFNFKGGQLVGNGAGLTNLNPYTPSSVTVFGTAPATNLLLDAAFGNVFRIVLTNNMGILFTNGTDAQVYTVSLFQDTVGTRTIAWVDNTGGTVTNFWNFGTDLPRQSVNLTTNASKLDIVRFTYRTAQAGVPNTTNRIDVIGEIKGF